MCFDYETKANFECTQKSAILLWVLTDCEQRSDVTVAAVAVALKEANTPQFVAYQQQVIANAKVLAKGLLDHGYSIVSGRNAFCTTLSCTCCCYCFVCVFACMRVCVYPHQCLYLCVCVCVCASERERSHTPQCVCDLFFFVWPILLSYYLAVLDH